MIPSFRRPRVLSVALLLLALVTVLLPAAGAFAEGAPYREVPGYPKYGCYDVIVGGNGMWAGNTPYPITVDVPGPVVDAHLQWLGTADGVPGASTLNVNGTSITGQVTDEYQPGANDPSWYMWRADIGPSGANLVQQGVNKYTISGWDLIGPTGNRRNGISVVVVYSTGACAKPNQVNLLDSFDWYWERAGGTTNVMTFTFPPSPNDRDVTVWLHHGGATHVPQQQELPLVAGEPEVYPDRPRCPARAAA